jgi:hypothetical protein
MAFFVCPAQFACKCCAIVAQWSEKGRKRPKIEEKALKRGKKGEGTAQNQENMGIKYKKGNRESLKLTLTRPFPSSYNEL